jgi:hypothetical protein
MSDTLKASMEKLESRILSVSGFAGIGIVDYGAGEKIEIAVLDRNGMNSISKILHESDLQEIPVSIVITGKTKLL